MMSVRAAVACSTLFALFTLIHGKPLSEPTPATWPNDWKAHVVGAGSSFALNGTFGPEGSHGTYYYDFNNNRARGDYVYNGTKPNKSGSQIWLGKEGKYLVYAAPHLGKLAFCIEIHIKDPVTQAAVGILLPDWMAKSNHTYVGRETLSFVDDLTNETQTVSTEHFKAFWGDDGEKTFDMWSDSKTGAPVRILGKDPRPSKYVVEEGQFTYNHFEVNATTDADFKPYWTWDCIPVNEKATSRTMAGARFGSPAFAHRAMQLLEQVRESSETTK